MRPALVLNILLVAAMWAVAAASKCRDKYPCSRNTPWQPVCVGYEGSRSQSDFYNMNCYLKEQCSMPKLKLCHQGKCDEGAPHCTWWPEQEQEEDEKEKEVKPVPRRGRCD